MSQSEQQPAYQDAEWLRREYHDNGRSTADIGAEAGVSESTIRYWMDAHDIDRRPVPSNDADDQTTVRVSRAVQQELKDRRRDGETLGQVIERALAATGWVGE